MTGEEDAEVAVGEEDADDEVDVGEDAGPAAEEGEATVESEEEEEAVAGEDEDSEEVSSEEVGKIEDSEEVEPEDEEEMTGDATLAAFDADGVDAEFAEEDKADEASVPTASFAFSAFSSKNKPIVPPAGALSSVACCVIDTPDPGVMPTESAAPLAIVGCMFIAVICCCDRCGGTAYVALWICREPEKTAGSSLKDTCRRCPAMSAPFIHMMAFCASALVTKFRMPNFTFALIPPSMSFSFSNRVID